MRILDLVLNPCVEDSFLGVRDRDVCDIKRFPDDAKQFDPLGAQTHFCIGKYSVTPNGRYAGDMDTQLLRPSDQPYPGS